MWKMKKIKCGNEGMKRFNSTSIKNKENFNNFFVI